MLKKAHTPEDLHVRRIGALAAASGVSVDTLRFYEREGLLPPATRTAGGFRLYPPEIAERLRFIKQGRELGLSLREIRQLVEPDNEQCCAVRDVIAARLADVDRRLHDLTSFRKTLQVALDRCEHTLSRSKKAACPVAAHGFSRR
jgi:MerR family Zn(II)-responsive transcriptional regulator of zntA